LPLSYSALAIETLSVATGSIVGGHGHGGVHGETPFLQNL
jgi:hypothetical protein